MAERISFFWQIPAHGHVWTNSPWRNETHTHTGPSPLHTDREAPPLVQSDSESTRRFDLKEIDKLQCWIQNKTLKAQYCSTDWKNLFFRRNIGNIKNLVNDLSDNRLRVFSRSS